MRRWLISVVMLLFVLSGTVWAEPVTLRWTYYGDAAFTALVNEAVSQFEAENPNIKIKAEAVAGLWDKLQVEYVAGTAPDITELNFDWFHPGMKAGMFTDLNPFMQKDRINVKDYLPLATSDWTVNNHLYAGILSLAGEIFAINKRIFNETGVNYPDNTWTWDTQYKVAKKMTKDQNGDNIPDQFGFTATFSIYRTVGSWIREAGGDVINEAGTASRMNESAAIQALDYAQTLWRECIVPNGYCGAKSTLFNQDKIGMARLGSWDARTMRDTFPNIDWDFAHPPMGPAGKRNLQWGSNAWSILSTSKHQEEAWQFMKFLITEKGQRIFGDNGMPGLTSVAKARSTVAAWPKWDYVGLVEDVINIGHGYYTTPDWGAWTTAVGKELSPVWKMTRSPQEAAQKSHDVITQIFSQRKK